MKTTKLFFMAALALMTAACSNDDNDLAQQPVEQSANNMITITAKLAPKSGVSGTRAVEDQSTYIESKWAENEHLAILYEKDGKQMADATITAVDGSGVATITFAVEAGTIDETDCQIIYPYSAAKADKTGLKDNYTLLCAQNGTLNANLDVRVGAGKIQVSTPGLDVTTQPAAQFAIWKLTLDQTAKDLYITADGVLIASATRSSAGTEFYVAVPVVDSKTVAVVATDGSSDCWSYSKDGVSLATGNYYQSNVAMTALDEDNSKPLYKITGTVDEDEQTIGAGKTVVLSGVNISDGSIACSGNATIILMGDNTVSAAHDNAAIKIGGSGTTLTITGSGSLTAQGGDSGAGIGTNRNESGGNIVINGGTVTATGGHFGAGIGTGRAQSSSITCGDITINGGTVIAQGVREAAGIGTGQSAYSGASNTCGAITIGTGVTMVTATKGSSAPNSIGTGLAVISGTQTCGTITFGSAQVFDGSAWSPATMVAGTYGGLNLAITTTTNTDDTWTLTPAP